MNKKLSDKMKRCIDLMREHECEASAIANSFIYLLKNDEDCDHMIKFMETNPSCNPIDISTELHMYDIKKKGLWKKNF